MTHSPLTNRVVGGGNKNRGAGPVNRIVVHHWAGTSGGDAHLINPNTDVSASYILYSDGTLASQVPEEYRPWTSGPTGDAGSVTVETQNSSGAPNWSIDARAKEKLAQLMADLSNRYGWGPLVRGTNVRVHQDFNSTACPGPDMLASLPSIIARANQIRGGGSTPPATGGKTDAQLAAEVWAGKHGNGEARKASLGPRYAAVQALVDQGVGKGGSAPAPSGKTDEQLAAEVWAGVHGNGQARKNSLGSRYAAVQALVDRGVGKGGSTGGGVDIDALARAVIRGDYGNGQDRKNRLGANYAAVQARVNQILG